MTAKRRQSDAIDEPKAIVDDSSLAVLMEEIRNLRREFGDWQQQVYLPGHERAEKDADRDRANRIATAIDLAGLQGDKWQENAEAHAAILSRLDSLNGFRNKVIGVLAVIGFAAPVAVAVWAIFTRGG